MIDASSFQWTRNEGEAKASPSLFVTTRHTHLIVCKVTLQSAVNMEGAS